MELNFNPDDMRSMIDYVNLEQDSENDPSSMFLLKFIENCLFLESQSHHWHLQCNLYDKHIELDELYKELPEFVDAFIEGMMESRGPIEPTGTSYVFQPVSECVTVLENFIDQCSYIHKLLDEDDEYSSVNTLEDIMSFVNGILYKLKFLN